MKTVCGVEGNRIVLRIFVQPKSSKTGWGSIVERDNASWIQLKVSSPPVDGAANKEVVKFAAKEFKTAKSNVKIIRGEKSRYKILELFGVNEEKWKRFMQEVIPACKH